ncbi:MAG: YcfL family protein [Victivallales bacterium]|nr:YcfL family protein [Victivallales bacterium]
MNKFHITALMLAAALLFCGCQNTVNTYENANRHAEVTFIATNKVITDSFLENRLGVRSVIEGETSAGVMQVQVEVMNRRTGAFSQLLTSITDENPYKVEYKFTWFDDRGMEVRNLNAGWKPLTIIPGQIMQIKGVAPNIYCKDFQLSLKEAE